MIKSNNKLFIFQIVILIDSYKLLYIHLYNIFKSFFFYFRNQTNSKI